MDYKNRDILFTLGTAVLLLVGIVLVFIPDPILTVIGIVLIAASGIVFIVDTWDILATTDENARE